MTAISSILNASRIARVARSDNLEQAAKMGILDRIIDYFRGGVKREAIKALLQSITDIKTGGKTATDPETQRLALFIQLRNLAQPEYRDQFKFDIYKSEGENFGLSLTIGGTQIYKNDDLSDFNDIQQIRNFFTEKFKMEIEDSVRNEDPAGLLATLNEVNALIDTDLSDALMADLTWATKMGADEKAAFSFEKMSEIFSALPADTRTMLHAQGTSTFGDRIRGILDFGSEVVQKASGTTLYIPDADGTYQRPMLSAEAEQTLLRLPLDLYARLDNLINICAEPTDTGAEIKDAAVSSARVDGDAGFVDGQADDVPILGVARVDSHRDLKAAEVRALEVVGISPDIQRLI